jgi:ElaB/YqjD/DUF883 family membrane-anchored ribosome-binding protein
MDTAHQLAEQSTDEMREEIDCTRSDLADKLEALEDRVMGSVQSAQETVEDSIQIARDTVATVKRTFDIKHHVEQYPWAMMGGSFVAGLALSTLFQRRGSVQSADRQGRNGTASSTRPALHTEQHGDGRFATAAPPPQFHSAPPSRTGFLDMFHDDIAKVKGMALAYVMGLARDALRDYVPRLAPQINAVMDSVTTKLGGEPVQQSST